MNGGRPALLRQVKRLLDVVGAALMVTIAALAFLQVAARYLFGFPTPWSEELLRLLFVAVVLLTAAFATHQRVDTLDHWLGPRGRRVQSIVNALFSCAMLAMLIVYGLDLVDLTAYDRFTALPLSVQWIYWSLVVGSALWFVRTMADLIWGETAESPTEL
jgi:TRAP-type transport system small permease protein